MGIVSSASAGTETDSVLKSFLSGFFQNTALLQPDGTYKSVVGGQTISIHPGSSMFGKRVEAIMYNELVSQKEKGHQRSAGGLSLWESSLDGKTSLGWSGVVVSRNLLLI
jgi:hypothetical protein